MRTKKRCPTCNDWVPLIKFGKDSSRRDGLTYKCKPCLKAAKLYRAAHPVKREVLKHTADGEKKCSYCDKILPVSAFDKNKSRFDGLSYQCKSCRHDRYVNQKNKPVKKCCKCHTLKSLTEFSSDITRGDRLSVRCKYCSSDYYRESRQCVALKRRGPKPKVMNSDAYIAALRSGAHYFHTETPCKCGTTMRYTATRICVHCSNERNRKNYEHRKLQK